MISKYVLLTHKIYSQLKDRDNKIIDINKILHFMLKKMKTYLKSKSGKGKGK